MADVYTDTYHDIYGTLSAPVVGGIFSLDGTNAPRLIVEVAWGGNATIDPLDGFFNLDVDVLGTGMLGSIGFVDVTGDVDSISIHRGAPGEQESPSPAPCTIILDNRRGDYDDTNTAGPYFGQIDVGQPVWVKAEWNGKTTSRWRGYVDDILPDLGQDVSTVTLVCTDALANLGRAKIIASTAVGAGETTGARINRLLDLAGHPTSQRRLATGLSTCQATTLGDYALSLISKAVSTELGVFYSGRDGTVIFRDRLYPYTNARATTVRALLTDTGADIDMVTLETGRRRGNIWNSASVTRDGGTEQTVTDVASKDKYGLQTYPGIVGEWLESDEDAHSIASWLVGWGKQSRKEVTGVAVQAATLGQWDTLLQLDILDRIRTVRDYGPVTVDTQVLIESYDETITKDSWDFVFKTRAADAFKPFVVDSSLLNTGTLA